MDLHAGAVAIGYSDDAFKLPIKLTFPYSLGPIPAYLTVGGSIAITPALSNESGFSARVQFHVDGTTGFSVTGTQLTGTGVLKSVEGAPPAVSQVSQVSTVTAGFGVLTEFPNVALGIGIAQVAALEGYVAAKQEVVMNRSLRLNSLGLISSSCGTINANVGAYVGGSFRLAGVQLTSEKQLFGEVNEVHRQGNRGGQLDASACD
jgi:hypothetical protein